MKIAHLADIHLGRRILSIKNEQGINQREADIYYVTEQVVEHICSQIKPDVCVIAGDLYDKTAPPIRAQATAFKICQRLTEAGIQIVLIGGNHDTSEDTSSMSGLEFLAANTKVDLALREYQTFDLEGVRFHALPYRAIANHVSGKKPLSPFDFSENFANVLIAHGYMPSEEIESLPDPVMLPRALTRDEARWQLICLGHIHTHQQLDQAGRIFYPGTLERLKWDEAGESPGFWVHQIVAKELIDSESVLVEDIVKDFPRPMIKLRKDVAEIPLDKMAQELNDELASRKEFDGAMLSIDLINVAEEIRSSSYKQMWEQTFYQRGGMELEVHFHSHDIIELLDSEISSTPEQLQSAWTAFAVSQDRKDLLDLGEQILEEAGEVLPS